MTDEHLAALIAEAGAKKGAEGWMELPEGRHITLYVSAKGSGMSVSRIGALRANGALVRLRTVKDEIYVLALEDIYAGSVDAPQQSARKAGFV